MNPTPVVFIHGTWLHALSWESWAERFAGRGFHAFTPGWPGEAAAVGELRRSPGTIAGIGLDVLTDHYAGIVRSFDTAPVIVGHSVGGLIAQHLLAANIGRAAVAIAPAPINDLALPEAPARLWTPDPTDAEPLVTLSPGQFHQVFANTATAEESDRLFERYVVPAPRRLLDDLGHASAARERHAVVDVGNADRGPLLLISGQEDLLVPDSVTRAAYKQYGDSTAVTDLKQFADRAHSLVIDNGWRFVADYVLGWLDEYGLRTHRG
ncbi:alpha/beta hydrolase [Streptomyces sp. NRRL B-24085]|uniref:alpha/beta hydrolase n=1 Tax=Streptomyces sp. NRRL B-24085 TaxID=1709476 RepID=UPI0006B3B3D9|nr:alpha/beta hydrolase [Streptomyces sp. NRRL B-24085]